MEDTKEQELGNDGELQELLSSLPKERNWEGSTLLLYKGFWYPLFAFKALISFQKHFHAHDKDIIVASMPKSGTTWLISLVYMIINRSLYAFKLNECPLLTSNPHDLIPFLELNLYLKNQRPDLEAIPDPRTFTTHTPYSSLPTSIIDSNCKIVYVCRNPMDQFISYWRFLLKIKPITDDQTSLEKAFEMHYKGIHSFGPFCNHVLEYWKASQENPDKVLFLKYEELKEDIIGCTKKLAEFLGFPFSKDEEEQGIVEEITRICSFENLKNLDVNKNGKRPSGAPNDAFFRKGEVGDWSNHLTPSMAERMINLLQEKLKGSGLSFDLSCKVQKKA
ncbi:cytosolic sulfotransferase 15 [Ricinus communis]|uniref:Sulfotransferase n=1 Tax=Ricinus communis TaxID=3988 RepID=B9SPC7_RICCO|nr:cytosolic sulfotransferase 15 [Ricinus communis]XP_048231487.1 cytosolic sulfotransferase 15 [Ricinus communis]XP_048231488.1 cytosolic sulfotransferase 15 [Ricinus communis]XP_048231489.1 cytosolic sulfotransferase 15 [Ricinus communis]EEF34549.1 Flavonol 3-sulfotransferase, putative [Ricinus communis]|eukprot:XP_015580051.1 cytosolic sulfotransferase 15 [Ricinus communis]